LNRPSFLPRPIFLFHPPLHFSSDYYLDAHTQLPAGNVIRSPDLNVEIMFLDFTPGEPSQSWFDVPAICQA
jgi:hypothetical protein